MLKYVYTDVYVYIFIYTDAEVHICHCVSLCNISLCLRCILVRRAMGKVTGDWS